MTVSRTLTDQAPAPDIAAGDGPHYRMFVRDLVLASNIGAHAHERGASQRVRINVDLRIRESPAPLGDSLANVLSYEDIVSGIRALIAEGHINLVETLAEKIARMCLADRRVARAVVRVEKLDLYTDATSVGVEIARRQPAEAAANVLPLGSAGGG